MKLKRCTCEQCKRGLRTQAQSEMVCDKVRAARHIVKQTLKDATKYDPATIADIVDTLPVAVTTDYTD